MSHPASLIRKRSRTEGGREALIAIDMRNDSVDEALGTKRVQAVGLRPRTGQLLPEGYRRAQEGGTRKSAQQPVLLRTGFALFHDSTRTAGSNASFR